MLESGAIMVCCFKRVVLSRIALLCKHGKVIIEVLARTHMFTSSAAPCHNPDTLSKHSSHLSFTVCKAMISSVLHFSIHCITTVWGVEPVAIHQPSWLGSTGVCGVRATKPLLRISPFTQKRDHDRGRTWHGRCCCSGGKAM